MSQQRVCDLDGTIIDPLVDLFYSVTDSRSGRVKDICYPCSRSINGTPVWTASTVKALDTRVCPTAGLTKAYRAIVAGTTGATQPTWPTTIGATVVDNTVTWICEAAPKSAAGVYTSFPGQIPAEDYMSMYGWMSGTNEDISSW